MTSFVQYLPDEQLGVSFLQSIEWSFFLMQFFAIQSNFQVTESLFGNWPFSDIPLERNTVLSWFHSLKYYFKNKNLSIKLLLYYFLKFNLSPKIK